MPLNLKATKSGNGEGGDYQLPPAGAQAARCVAVIDLGVHMESYQGQPAKPKPKLLVVWELTNTDERFLVCKEYLASLHESALLRKDLKAWRNGKDFAEGEDFHIKAILGKPCLVTIEHKQSAGGNTYGKVIGVGCLPPGYNVQPAGRAQFLYEGDEPFEGPEWELPRLYGRPVAEVVREGQALAHAPADHTPAHPGSPAWQRQAAGLPAEKQGTTEQRPTHESARQILQGVAEDRRRADQAGHARKLTANEQLAARRLLEGEQPAAAGPAGQTFVPGQVGFPDDDTPF